LLSVEFLFLGRDMHLFSKINVNLVSSCHSYVPLYMAVYFIITFHLFCTHDSYAVHMHAYVFRRESFFWNSNKDFWRSSSKFKSRRCRPQKEKSMKKNCLSA